MPEWNVESRFTNGIYVQLVMETTYMDISSAVHAAIALAKEPDETNREKIVTFEFNDRRINVRGDSNPNLILRDFWRKPIPGKITNIGPDCDPADTDEDHAFALERGGTLFFEIGRKA